MVSTAACQVVTSRPNLDHCTYNDGDRYCAEIDPSVPYCASGKDECALGGVYGCVAEVAPQCHAPCGILDDDECMSGSSSGTDSGSESGSESGSSGSESGSESSTTGSMPCVDNEGCPDEAEPLCEPVSGECVTCDAFGAEADAACAGLDGGVNPVCFEGACVQCTAAAPQACTGMTPICDDASNACVPCTAHDECAGEAACNLYTGACLPNDEVVHVGPGQTYGTLAEAVSSFAAGAEGTIVVHEPVADYNEAVVVNGGRVLAFLAADDVTEPPRWLFGAGTAPQLTVQGNATVLLEGLRMSGNANDVGLLVDGGRAWVDRSRIVQNSGGGIVAQAGAELTLRNCFVGQAVNNRDALSVDGASVTAVYSTLVGAFNAAALVCTSPVTVDIRNSILVTEGGVPPDEVDCAVASITYSATEGALGGTGNASVGMFPSGADTNWFVDYTGGNFRLQNQGLDVFADVAQWQTGDPPIDIDGQPRPTEDGMPDYAGADVP